MILIYLFNISVLLLLAISTWQVLEGSAPSSGWQHYYYLAAPWLLLYFSIKGWYRCFRWRRMMMLQHISPDLSRGKRRPSKSMRRSGFLEKSCISLLLLSLSAILTQAGVPVATWWIAIIAGFYFTLSVLFNLMT